MKQVFLYKCNRCDTVIAVGHDRGKAFYVDKCGACNEWSDFFKIVVARKENGYKESEFFMEEDKKDDKEEG